MTTHTYDKDLPKGFIPDEDQDDDLPAGFVPDDDKKKREDGGTTSGTGSAGKSPSSEEVAEGIFSYKRQVARKPMPANPAAARQRDAQLQAARNVISQSSIGAVKPEELSEAFNSLYGKEEVDRLVFNYADDYDDIKAGKASPERWQELAQTINETNVGNRKTVEEKGIADNDALINDAIANLNTGVGLINIPGRDAVKETYISFGDTEALKNIDVNDPKQLSELYEQLENARFVVNKSEGEHHLKGKSAEDAMQKREQLMQAILEKQKYLVSKQGVNPEVQALNHRIGDAVAQANRERELGENIDRSEDSDWLKNDEINSHHFQLGLSMLKDLKPGRYANIIRAINERGKIAKNDYTEIASIGQEINNIQTFRGAADDKSLIGKETSLDYSTDETRKMEYARIIGERARQQGIRGREFSQEQIFKLGYDLPNKTTLKQLADEEAILGYDAIPKSGVVEAFVRGVQLPFAGIESTARSLIESPAETYLRSRRTDVGVGGQKVADEKGQVAANLPSERGNIFLDAVNGFGQFIPQVLLTKGVGGVLNKALGTTGTALASGITNYGGTAISTYFQTYGDAYADALDKTGDVGTAKLMGNIGGVSAAAFELMLPDVKIADKAFSGLQKTLAKDLMDVVRKGGDLDALAKAGRPAVQKFVKEALSTSGQEVAEEVGTQLVDYITESIFSPRTAKDRDLSEELLETAKATAVSMSIPAIFGGAGAAMRKDFTENAFHAAAINFNEYASALKKQYENGNISKDEHDKALTLLSTHKQSLDTKPTEDANGKRLNGQQQLDYALEETKIKTNKEKEKNVSGVQKEVFEGKIKQSEEIQRGILMPEPTQRRAVQAETDQWKQNIAAIEDRTDITPEQKETLKQAEDARHAQAISSLINKPKIQTDANVQKDQKRDNETKDTPKVQRQTDGESVKDGKVQQEKVVTTEGAATTEAAPSFEEQIAELQKNRQLDSEDIDKQIEEVKGFAPSATKDIQVRNLEQTRKEQNDYYDTRIKELQEEKAKPPKTETTTTTVSDEPLNEQELAAVVGLSGKEFGGEGTFMKPAIEVLKNPDATSQQKRQALKDISDQLLAPITEATTGELLGKEADLIYDLGYEAPKENEALKEAAETTTKKVTQIVLEAVRVNNQGEINRLVKIVTDAGGKAGVAGIAEQYNKDIDEGKETELTRSVDKLLEGAKEAAGITTTQPKETKKRPTTKAEIDALPDEEKDAAIDALIYGDEAGEQSQSPENVTVKLHDRPALEYPVYSVTLHNGQIKYIQRSDNMNSGSLWYEVKKDGKYWTDARKSDKPWTMPGMSSIGDNKAEAVKRLTDEAETETGQGAPDETNPKTAVKIEAIPANGTVESTLKLLADSENEFSDLAKEILRTTDKKSLAVPIKVQKRPGGRSVYQTSRDQIIIDPSSKQDARVIMHEIIHGTTSRKIDNALKNPSHGNSYGKAYLKALQDYLKNPLGRPEIKRLVNLYLKAAKELGYEKQLFEGGALSKRYQGRTMQTGSGLFLPGGTQADANRVKNTLKDIVGEENIRVWNNGYGYWQVNVTGDGVEKLKASPLYSEKVETWETAEGDKRTKEQRKYGYVTFEYDKKQNATAGNADLTVERGMPYGMGNLDEFLAEAFSNPAFQEKLASIKDDSGVSLWKRFLDAIKKIAGIDVNNTLLESVIKNGAEIISRERDAAMQLSLDLQSPVNIQEAKKRMTDAGYSEAEIKAEFEKRGLPYEQPTTIETSEPPAKKGRVSVTMSGMTEPERQAAIKRRKRETFVPTVIQDEQKALERIRKYNAKDGTYKRSSKGLSELNNLRLAVDDLNKTHNKKYTIETKQGVHTLKNENGVAVKTNNKATGDQSIDETGKPIMQRSDRVKEVFRELLNRDVVPTGYTVNGTRMSDSQLDNTIQDILDGIPSRAANNYLDNLEKMIAADSFDYSSTDRPTHEQIKYSDMLAVAENFPEEEITEDNLETFLAGEGELNPEQTKTVNENLETLIDDNESTTTEAAVQPATEGSTTADTNQAQPDTQKPAETGETTQTAEASKARFNAKVDRIGDAAKSFFNDLLGPNFDPGDVKKAGFSINDIIDAGTDALKAVYSVSYDAAEAVNKAIEAMQKKWDETVGKAKAFPEKEMRSFFKKELEDFIPKQPRKPQATKQQIKESEFIGSVLSTNIDANKYPTIFENNETKKQITAVTQGIGQNRIVDGDYVVALRDNLREISLQSAKLLKDELGKDWAEKTLKWMEDNPANGNIAQVIGVLNVMSTENFQDIENTHDGNRVRELEKFQKRIDKVTNQRARSASLGLQQRILYKTFATGGNMEDVLSNAILSPEVMDMQDEFRSALNEDITDAEINRASPTGGAAKLRKVTGAAKRRSNPSLKDDLKNRAAASANKTGKSITDLIKDANDKIKNIKGC